MENKKVAEIMNDHLEHLQKLAHQVTHAPEVELIHQFRVHTKKLRALLRLLSEEEKTEFKLTNKFRELYAASGVMRDAQLMLVKIEEAGIPEVQSWLEAQVKDGWHQWKKRYEYKVLEDLDEKLSEKYYPHINAGTLNDFFTERIDAIKKIVASGKFPDEKLHDIRKKLKDMQYITALCKDEWEHGYQLLQQYDPGKLQELSDKAGNYNDHRNALDWLASYEDETYVVRDKEAVLKVQLHWLEQKLQQKEELVQLLIKTYPAG